jgi:hypothetical protein
MRATWIACLLAIGTASCATARPPATFDSPEIAVSQLVAALRTNDVARLEEMVGEENEDLIGSGDEVADSADREKVLALYEEKSRLDEQPDGSLVLCIGEIDWPMPIPIVSTDEGWIFDAEAGRDEVLSRRVGENELNAVQVCLAYVDAQVEYYGEDRDGDGIREYARRFASTEGKRDGLFWPTEAGQPPSPLGELAAEAAGEGYTRKGDGPTPYHGYLYRILEAQGAGAPGGAYDYLVRENLIGGFALIAYPAEYGSSGVMSFAVSHDGIVFEKDLGTGTRKSAEKMKRFDPSGWNRVGEEAAATAP